MAKAKKQTAGQKLTEWREEKYSGSKTAAQTRAAGDLGYSLMGYRKLEEDNATPPISRAQSIEQFTGIDGLMTLWYPELS